ncbi:zn-finger in ubiquitin-hydrolases and other family protein [Rhodococcus sp. MTM3W5.2]|uniref:UBP-type zinc finger domain-containing protein n=1 Tax=Rhodococcus sp. MTM3W5.2 TaxID=1805827 RepID=UPI0009792EE9|nr:UBP-type zinc finger domain-containing protein [Rhodococcus sp. MTM3W5.2]AQA26018.1 zn-finger in ubiquitin-hydrolases and other family protein [Rhodococcus sp. MTM3W5.2]
MKRVLRRAADHIRVGSPDPAAAESCDELAAATGPDPEPRTPGLCEECTALGEQNWAHLRMCLTCGHVGCCDSSPHRHATAHFEQTGHPVMRSHEPGEAWRWCYQHAEMG